MNKLLAVVAVILMGMVSGFAQEPLANYKSRSIAEITELNKASVEAAARRWKEDDETELLATDPFYSKVELLFQGAARPVSEGRKKLIGEWGKRVKLDKKTTDPYVNELKFSEAGKEYWIGIPNSLIPSIAGKVKKGESVSLYVSYIGVLKPRDSKDYETILIITAID